MHVISSNVSPSPSRFYLKRSCFTRPGSLCSVFRKLRQHRGLTKRALAAKFGASEEYVSAIESGLKFPSLRYCLFCADMFGANPLWVKTMFAREAVSRFSSRLNGRLGLADYGGLP